MGKEGKHIMTLALLHAGPGTNGPVPSLDLRFAQDLSLTGKGPTPSFSRASTGSYFDSAGVLRYANVNTILYSEEFGNAYWAANASTVTQNTTNGPTGYATADSLFEASGVNYHGLFPASGVSVNVGQNYTLSVYVKKGNRRYFVIGFSYNAGLGSAIQFDLDTATVVYSFANGGYGITSSSATNVGNGWIRISAVLTSTSSPVYPAFANSDVLWTTGNIHQNTYSGDPTKFTYIWGAQLESSSTVGTYCPTTSSANSAPRFDHTYDGTRWVSRGLLVEEQRTNLILRSEEFNTQAPWFKDGSTVSSDSIASPAVTITADKLVENSANSAHLVYQPFTFNGGIYTFSCYAKAGERGWLRMTINNASLAEAYFNISSGAVGNVAGSSSPSASIVNIGNGWYRCILTATPPAGSATVGLWISSSNGTNSYLGDGASGIYVWGAQLEAHSFPTSYIHTTSSSVVRSADVCQITGSDFSGFWNQPEGTFACELDVIGFDSSKHNYFGAASTGSISQYAFVGRYSANPTKDINFQLYNGASFCNIVTGSGTTSPTKIAFGMKVDDCAASVNGGAVVSDNTATMTTALTQLEIGNFLGANYLNGHIARLRYYPKRLPNATLQKLST